MNRKNIEYTYIYNIYGFAFTFYGKFPHGDWRSTTFYGKFDFHDSTKKTVLFAFSLMFYWCFRVFAWNHQMKNVSFAFFLNVLLVFARFCATKISSTQTGGSQTCTLKCRLVHTKKTPTSKRWLSALPMTLEHNARPKREQFNHLRSFSSTLLNHLASFLN